MHCEFGRDRHQCMRASATHRRLIAINFGCIVSPGVAVITAITACAHRRHIAGLAMNFRCIASPGVIASCLRSLSDAPRVQTGPSSVRARIGDASQVACDQFPMNLESRRDHHQCICASATHPKLLAINFRRIANPGMTIICACAHRRRIASCLRSISDALRVQAQPSSVHARIGDTSQVACDQIPTHCESKRDRHQRIRASATHQKLLAVNFRCIANSGVTIISACALRRHIAGCIRSISNALRVQA